jgi:drug/metabolite transporter (DMT)-like permease
MLNCLSYALFMSYSRKFLMEHDRLWTTAFLFLYGSVGLTLLAAPGWAEFQMPVMTPTLAACMVFAVVGGTFLTYFLNIWALAHTKTSSVAIFIYLQPVVAALLAWFWHGEMITMRTIGSSALIFAGLLLAL